MEAFDELDVKPPMVISLAKKEELIYVQDASRADPPRRATTRASGCARPSAMRPTASPSTTTTCSGADSLEED